MTEKWFACASTVGRGEEKHTEQWQLCGVPEDLVLKPEIELELLKNVVKRDKLVFSWVAADAMYGDAPAIRGGVADTEKFYS
jgi:SRSO17 transposase